jgi:hypothetical protein
MAAVIALFVSRCATLIFFTRANGFAAPILIIVCAYVTVGADDDAIA